jgi:hypothetical protein
MMMCDDKGNLIRHQETLQLDANLNQNVILTVKKPFTGLTLFIAIPRAADDNTKLQELTGKRNLTITER